MSTSVWFPVRLAVAGAAACALLACGGSDDSGPQASGVYTGTLTGQNCFTGGLVPPETAAIRYTVTVDPLAATPVRLVDEQGRTWTGPLTSDSSFEVFNPALDARFSIKAAEITGSTARVDSTTSCVSFRCCTTLSGTAQITRL